MKENKIALLTGLQTEDQSIINHRAKKNGTHQKKKRKWKILFRCAIPFKKDVETENAHAYSTLSTLQNKIRNRFEFRREEKWGK